MTAPATYADALLVPTLAEEVADLLSRFPGAPSAATIAAAIAAGLPAPAGSSSILAGWSPSDPQRMLLDAEAQAILFEMVQRAALSYAASPQQVRLLREFYVSQGYSAADAASLASTWVDVTLTVYQSPRLAATVAMWTVPLIATSPQTINAQSVIVLQSDDGIFFLSGQVGDVVLSSGNSFKGVVTFQARAAGTTGNVVPGSIEFTIQAPAGVKVDLTAAQALLQPARDAESDEDALDRAVGRWGTLAGILTAAGWRFVMQTPELGGVSSLTRIFVDDARGDGKVGITVANTAGAPTAAELAIAVAQAVKYSIAGGPIAEVSGAAVLTVAITVSLKTDGTNQLAAAQCASALVQLGGKVENTLYLDDVRATCKAIAGVVGDVGLSLTDDVARPALGVIVISPTVTAT